MNNVIIMAAGKGSRMKTALPKCAVPILGKPMILYLIDMLQNFSFDKTICVVGHQKQILIDLLKERVRFVEQPTPLGTGDAIIRAMPFIKSTGFTIIMSGDTPLISADIIKNLIHKHLEEKNDLTITTTFLRNPFGYGRIIRNRMNEPIDILEEKEANEIQKATREINVGLYCIQNESLLKHIFNLKPHSTEEYYITDIVGMLSKTGKVGAYTVEDSYHIKGINDLNSLASVEDELRKHIIMKHILNGVHICQPNTITIGEDVQIEAGTTIHSGSILLGNCFIGKDCVIGPNTELLNTTTEESIVCKQSVVFDSYIGHHTTIGPFAHLRSNCKIGPYNRIGNFVELKNTNTKEHTKIAHLAYLGDTVCGARVNWGCGSITVNYNGKEKNKTIVEDDVFIGCNSNLIAPITLQKGSYIAAGSTITENLDEGDFAIARVKQLTKKNYAQKYYKGQATKKI